MYNYGSYSRDNLAAYIFRMFDGDTGVLELTELNALVKYVHGGHVLDARVRAALDNADVSSSVQSTR